MNLILFVKPFLYLGLPKYIYIMSLDNAFTQVFQQRMVGTEDFDRSWDDYLKGFGDVSGDHWLGIFIL